MSASSGCMAIGDETAGIFVFSSNNCLLFFIVFCVQLWTGLEPEVRRKAYN
ncbi:MAG: hypothetical protein ACOYOA_12675 [Saprospiraceae bacterium]